MFWLEILICIIADFTYKTEESLDNVVYTKKELLKSFVFIFDSFIE